MGSPSWDDGCTLCQGPELPPPGPEEVRVWLLFPQLHPVAVAVEILGQGRKEGKGELLSSPNHHLQP